MMSEESETVDGKDVASVMDDINALAKHLCWVPSKMQTFDVWRGFLTGLAENEGLDVSFETKVASTDVEVSGSKLISDGIVRVLLMNYSRESPHTRKSKENIIRDDDCIRPQTTVCDAGRSFHLH